MNEKAKLPTLAGTQRIYVEEGADVVAVVEALANPHLRGAIITIKAGRSVDLAALGHCLIGHGISVLVHEKLLGADQGIAIQDMIADQSGVEWEYADEGPDIPF